MVRQLIKPVLAVFTLASIVACTSRSDGSHERQNLPDVSAPAAEQISGDTENSMESLSIDIKPGTWGGQGIILTIGKGSSKIEMDCANATVSGPFRAKKGGKFRLTGSLTRQGFGPVLANALPKAQPAAFEGKVSGNRMTLKVVIVKTGEVYGTYDLEAGKPSEMTRCR
ncbi:MAG: hypothetical protein ABL999_00010 [Pyrinomonadaceae bacterium]